MIQAALKITEQDTPTSSQPSATISRSATRKNYYTNHDRNRTADYTLVRRLFHGCFPLCQRFRKFRSEFKWKGPFRFLPTGIFGITSGGGPLISVGIFRSKFAVPFLTNRFFALIREFGNDKKWQEPIPIGWRGLIGKCRSIFLG